MNNCIRYANTLSYFRLSQIGYLIVRRVLPNLTPELNNVRPRIRQGVVIRSAYQLPASTSAQHSFCFLNRRKDFPSGKVDWACGDMAKLWRYNLHYFDYLNDVGLSKERKCELIGDWIANNPPTSGDGWESYPVSLRVVNWIKWFLLSECSLGQQWLESLYQQVLWLESNIEYHLLANHYLKNGVALFFAGMFFQGSDAERWFKKGRSILREELEEQFLPDGGHYERSPMYHSICVMDYLDVLNLMQSSQSVVTFDEYAHVKKRTCEALDCLNDICLPDRNIPLFNDSAFNIAPSPTHIFEYAATVVDYKIPGIPAGLSCIEKASTGYYVIRNGDAMMIVDCGLIGPNYQPGHAHCDTLSYELAINGRRVVVDSGVRDYEASPQRAYARSTRAHNTVSVDGQEQSEIWGVFRVARRAKPLYAGLTKTCDGVVHFEGAHDGFKRLPGRLIHRRQIIYDGRSEWKITDYVEGKGNHRIESYIHLHPDYKSSKDGGRIHILDAAGDPVVVIEADNDAAIEIEAGQYFPEFGVEMKNDVIVLSRTGYVPIRLGYRISKLLK